MNFLEENSKKNEIIEMTDFKENLSASFIEKISNDSEKQIQSFKKINIAHTRLMKYPSILMKTFGFFHQKNDCKIFKGYCFSMIVVLWANSIRYLFTFNGENESFLSGIFIFKSFLVVMFSLVAINSTLMFINQEYYSRENAFLDELDLLFQNINNLEAFLKKLGKKINVMFLILTLIALADVFFVYFLVFFPEILTTNESELAKLHLTPFHKQGWSQNSFWYKQIICISQSLAFIHGCWSFGYLMAFCKIVRFLFVDYNTNLEKSILNRETQISEIEF
jgi:hypothetical protein